jgi:hypothetical protein
VPPRTCSSSTSNMPKLLGPELAALLKSAPGMKEVPILFLSGMTGKVHKDLAAYARPPTWRNRSTRPSSSTWFSSSSRRASLRVPEALSYLAGRNPTNPQTAA